MIASLRKSPARVAAVGALGLLLLAAVAFGAGSSADTLPAVGYARLALGTLVAVGLVLLSARFLPRLLGAQSIAGEGLRVVASLPVGQRERVVLIQVGGEQVLLGVAPGRVAMLRKLPSPLPTREPSHVPVPASGWIERVLGKPR